MNAKKILLAVLVSFPLCGFPSTAFGRATSLKEQTRVRDRLELIETLLRGKSAENPALEQERQRQLGFLHEYWRAGDFPKNSGHEGERVPYFIDHEGTPCAVGYLLLRSGKRELVERVRNGSNHIFIDQISDPEFLAWAAGSGLSLTELGLIQPTYDFERQRPKPPPLPTEPPPPTPFEAVKKKIQEHVSDITGTDDLSLMVRERKNATPLSVTMAPNFRARNNGNDTIEWGDKKESRMADCWQPDGCSFDHTYSHTYEKTGSYRVRVRRLSYDCKPEPNSRCEDGHATKSYGPELTIEAK